MKTKEQLTTILNSKGLIPSEKDRFINMIWNGTIEDEEYLNACLSFLKPEDYLVTAVITAVITEEKEVIIEEDEEYLKITKLFEDNDIFFNKQTN